MAVKLGAADCVQPVFTGSEYMLREKSGMGDLQYDISLPEAVSAPVAEGQVLGTMTVRAGEETVAQVDIVAAAAVERLGFWALYGRLLGSLIGRNAG